MAKKRFKATIEAGGGGGAFVAIPFDVEKTYGTRGRVKVKVDHGGRRLKCRAKVIWTRRIADDVHELGLSFTGLRPKKVAVIHRLSEAG